MNNTPDYENDLVFKPKDTNYDTLKEYEAHGEPLPSYDDWKAVNELEKITLKDRAKVANQLVESQNKNRKLKELLKECELWFTGVVGNMNDKNVGEHNRNLPIF